MAASIRIMRSATQRVKSPRMSSTPSANSNIAIPFVRIGSGMVKGMSQLAILVIIVPLSGRMSFGTTAIQIHMKAIPIRRTKPRYFSSGERSTPTNLQASFLPKLLTLSFVLATQRTDSRFFFSPMREMTCLEARLFHRLDHRFDRNLLRIILDVGFTLQEAHLSLFNAVEPFQGPLDRKRSRESRHPPDPETHLRKRGHRSFTFKGCRPAASGSVPPIASRKKWQQKYQGGDSRQSCADTHSSPHHQRPERGGKKDKGQLDGQHNGRDREQAQIEPRPCHPAA